MPGEWIDGDDKGFLILVTLENAFRFDVGEVNDFVGEADLTLAEIDVRTTFIAGTGRIGGPMTLSILGVRDLLPEGDGEGDS